MRALFLGVVLASLVAAWRLDSVPYLVVGLGALVLLVLGFVFVRVARNTSRYLFRVPTEANKVKTSEHRSLAQVINLTQPENTSGFKVIEVVLSVAPRSGAPFQTSAHILEGGASITQEVPDLPHIGEMVVVKHHPEFADVVAIDETPPAEWRRLLDSNPSLPNSRGVAVYDGLVPAPPPRRGGIFVLRRIMLVLLGAVVTLYPVWDEFFAGWI